MPLNEKLLKEIREEIAKDELEKAFSLIISHVDKSNKHFEEILSLKGVHDYIALKNARGLINPQELSIEKNNIRYQLLELLKQAFPNSKAFEEKEELGLLDYFERFQKSLKKFHDFSFVMRKNYAHYKEQTASVSEALKKAKQKGKGKGRFNNKGQTVKSLLLQLASHASEYSNSMENQIETFKRINKTLVDDLFQSFTSLGQLNPKNRLAFLVRLNRDLDGFIQVYENYKKIAVKDIAVHEHKIGSLTQQLKLSYKKIAVKNSEILISSDEALKKAQQHKETLKRMIIEEKIKRDGFWNLIWTALKYWMNRLFRRG